LDQIRVDVLPPSSFDKQYDRGMWKRYRKRHLAFINHLLLTIEQIPTRDLRQLSALGASRKSAVVRKAIVELLSLAATDSLASGQIDSAPSFLRFVTAMSCTCADRVDIAESILRCPSRITETAEGPFTAFILLNMSTRPTTAPTIPSEAPAVCRLVSAAFAISTE
jgi:hypothetical protein